MTFHIGQSTYTCDHVGCLVVQHTAAGFESHEMVWHSIGMVAGLMLAVVVVAVVIRLAVKRAMSRRQTASR